MISMFSVFASIAGVFVIAPIELSDNVRTVCTFIYCIAVFTSVFLEGRKNDKIRDLSKKIDELETKIGVLERRNK